MMPSGGRDTVVKRILVVEDDPGLARAIRRMLVGHDVVTVTDGFSAVSNIDLGEIYDIIVTDLMMPEMSGIQLYETIAKRAPALARSIIFMTGGAASPSAREFLARTDRPILEKPFDKVTLLATIARVAA
jgi:CheY-like chemotaxis protein